MRGSLVTVIAAVLGLGLGIATAQENDPLAAKVEALLDATTPDARAKGIAEITALKLAYGDVRAGLAAGRRYAPDAKTGWISFTVPGAGGAAQPHLAWIPADYDPARRYPVIVDMHGGVSRPQVVADQRFKNLQYRCGKIAQDAGWILLMPKGKRGLEWWTDAGARNVLDGLEYLKRRYNVDENRVYPTGFSDGGSGAYYFGMANPTPFAGLIPLNGMPVVAQTGGLQAHLRNMVNKPIYAVNTGRDTLYPAALVKPFFDLLKKERDGVIWKVYEQMPHAPLYMDQERPKIRKWMEAVERAPHPDTLVWETADPKKYGRIHWLTVTRIGSAAGAGEGFPDLNPKLQSRAVRLGIQLDTTHEGAGVRVARVTARSTAATMGMKPGDRIVKLDGNDLARIAEQMAERMAAMNRRIGAADALRAVLRRKQPGQAVTATVVRGEKPLELKGEFPAPPPRAAFRRVGPWGSIRARVEANTIHVTCCNVRAFTLDLSDKLVDFTQPLVVRVNGREVMKRTLTPDLRVLLEKAARDRDRTMLYDARVAITVPAATPERPKGKDL